MSVTGIGAPRVVVTPPNTPAPPPISLLTQNNVVSDDRDAIGDGQADRWLAGGGVTWMSPFKYAPNTWQQWYGDGGTADSAKNALSGIGDRNFPPGADDNRQQMPIVAFLRLTQGALADWALRNAVEGTVEDQLLKAFAAGMPRVIEHELWAANVVARAGWENQFRLCGDDMGLSQVGSTGSPPGVITALALIEQAIADHEIIDQGGGAFIHVSPMYMSLLASAGHGLTYSPSGRQITTSTGCHLVPGPGAAGKWTVETSEESSEPGGFGSDNISKGWIFGTPPVRVRLSGATTSMRSTFDTDTNDYSVIAEQGFVMECDTNLTGIVCCPVDYTKEF